MQGLHHQQQQQQQQQQQLAALLSVALPKDDSISISTSTSTSSTTTPTTSSNSEDDDSARLAALNSLHRAILYPPNLVLVTHSASFLSQGFSKLLSDKSYSVRQSAATAYGALCAVVCSIPLGTNGRQNHVMLGSLVDRFISWALPLLSNVGAGDRTTELALEGLREFLSVGDLGGIERYAATILKSCQELLEDERTSLSLLNRLLGLLTLISLKFYRTFQPHFLDIVDLLLGWALVPDLAESDRCVIMDSFLQFQKHWVGHLQFSLGLLSKFLGDMDVLLQDESNGTPQQFRRSLALLSCFCTVLQSTASGLLELNILEQISEPLSNMLPRLLGCLSMVGRKFGWSKWIQDSWKCLTLLAEILRERFSTFYPLAIDVLFQSLNMDSSTQPVGVGKITSIQIHGVLKTNLQLLSLQKLGLLPSSVEKVMQFEAPISQLRLHPNHLVTGSSAATYIFLLQHGSNEVVEQALAALIEELQLLKGMLGITMGHRNEFDSVTDSKSYSELELFSLIKFDLKVLLTCVSMGGVNTLIGKPDVAALYFARTEELTSFIIEKLNPFELPIEAFVELQVDILKTLDRLTAVEVLSKSFKRKGNSTDASSDVAGEEVLAYDDFFGDGQSALIIEHLRKYNVLFVKALHVSSPLSVKVVVLQWVKRFCENLIDMHENLNVKFYFYEAIEYDGSVENMVFSILNVAFDREPKVRSHVASVLELLLLARLIHPMNFYPISEVVLEKLGDSDVDIRNAFVRLLSNILPTTVHACGLYDCETFTTCRPSIPGLRNSSFLHWKQIFALKRLHRQLHSQQLVSILSYISQRWKVPLSSWIQRLINSCQSSKDYVLGEHEETGNFGIHDLLLDIKVDEDTLERISFVNNLAGAWWAIQEAARYCVAMRLRTSLGGPTQTFAALERMLLDIAHVLQLDSEQNDGGLSLLGSSGAHLLPMRLLLDFVEALKKNVYNAYEGSVVLPSSTRQSTLFFRANKKVCEEWFSRICEPMMNAGLALQCHDATIQYCTLRLQELKNLLASAVKDKSRAQVAENLHNIRGRFSGDIFRVLRHMSLALCRRHDSDSLIGLQNWVSLTFSSFLLDEKQSLNHNGMLGPFPWITGLVYQAKGQYEKAAAHFAYLLQTEDSLSSMGSNGVQFAIARIIESYTAVSDWKSLEFWLLELQALRAKHAGKSYSGALTTAGNEINSIHALAHFDEGDYQAAWACLDLTPKSSTELTLDPKLALQRSEQMLLQALLLLAEGKADKVPHELQKAKIMLEETLSVLPLDGLAEAAPYATQFHCIFAFNEGWEHNENRSRFKQNQSILSAYVQSPLSRINKIHQDCNPWIKVFRVYRTIFPNSTVTLKLCMNMLSLARKQGNLMLANRLNNYLREHVLSCSEERYRNFLILKLQYEGILLMHAENKFEDALANLWSFVRPCIVSPTSMVSDADDSILKAEACLKLSDWLRRDYPDLNLENLVFKMRADFKLSEVSSFGIAAPALDDENLSSKPSVGVTIEEIVGTAIKSSTHLCSTMDKSWISYATWCFCQAKDSLLSPHGTVLNSCSFSSVLVPEILPERFKLTEDEIIRVESLILQLFESNCSAMDLNDGRGELNYWLDSGEHLRNDNHMKALVSQVVDMIETASGTPGAEYSSGNYLSATLASQLKIFFLRKDVNLEESKMLSVVDNLVDVSWSLRRRRVSLFGHAARGFIQYLSYSSSKPCNGQLSGPAWESLEQKTGSYTLRSILTVLHIILNYGVELKDTLEPALSMVPLTPWQEVTPQLFARLSSHPEQVVRKQLEGLLMMLAKLSPWSVVYPTLVDVNANEEKPSEELQHIFGCLRELYPQLIQDVQLMINELGNVTVLWEELWLSTLQDLHTDVMSRINVLKEEAARIAENATLSQSEKNKISAAKYSAMMAPIVVALERRLASSSRKPETPHEIWFHKEYKEQLKTAILTFKSPPASAAALGDVWRPFDNIAASLASYQRKSSISLGEVAPQLALLSSSDVPMPGLEKQVAVSESDSRLASTLQGIVTIASFFEQLTILATKTKPKKLAILGSDGKKYTYLLKGREDLRLDARIMQLLQAINSFLQSSPATSSRSLGIRYYSVTPISGRAGLIQWVDNVISIYSVFKSWQNRVQLAQFSATGAGNTKNPIPPPAPRPSDMFYGKIIPALKEKGLRRVISRRDWPHEVKLKVLLDLMKEVPRDLLHEELWCASGGFKAFSSKLKRYSGSVAAMSMVGHVLGLGDRHLDNILIDFCSGDIVHIDYNVCFDKGQRLKVPEIVPFRLTQIIEAALGLTGIEGTFRANCEAVVTVLRKNKDILLMLLEVFVWDPLVEWTRGDFHDDAAIGGEERKGMELAVSLSLFASRMQEIRVPLQEHHDLLLSSLPEVESAIERFADILNKYELASTVSYRADQERSNLVLHETSAKSIVAEATSNADKSRALFEIQAREFAQAKAVVAEKTQEATTWMEQHGRILDALRSNLVLELNTCINLSGTVDALSITSAVLVAGVPLTVVPEPTQVQCHEIDREVTRLISELDNGLSSAVTTLQVYSLALQRILPLNYVTTSPVHGWSQVLQLSANALSSDVISLGRRQAASLIGKVNGDNLDSVKNIHSDLCFKVEKYALEIEKVEKEYAELVNSIGSETESKAKDRLMSAFIKYIRSEDANFSNISGQSKYDWTKDVGLQGELEERKDKVLSVINISVSSLYNEVRCRVVDIFSDSTGEKYVNSRLQADFGSIFCLFEEQVEKCMILAGFVNELWQLIGRDMHTVDTDIDFPKYYSDKNWVSIFKATLLSCKTLVGQMTEVVLPDVLRSAVSFNSEVMDAFGLISQIRGSTDMALEQLLGVELERASLVELEQNYFVKVGLITEQQLALEEAAMKGRDHLSWEEAEELASQEEACRAQLEQLHQTWNQRDIRRTSLIKREADINNALNSSERHLQSLISVEEIGEPHVLTSNALLAMLMKPFSELEPIDKALSTLGEPVVFHTDRVSNLADLMSSGHSVSEYIWKFGHLLNNHSFFIWKVGVVDAFLDSCIHYIASSLDQNLGFDQLFNVVKKKLEIQLHQHISQYLKERVAPTLFASIAKEIEQLKQLTEAKNNLANDQVKKDLGSVRWVQLMLEEYCNAHETARAARSAASLMLRQVNELREALCKTSLEIVQMEWMNDASLTPSHNSRITFQRFLSNDDNLYPIVINISRLKLLESIQSAISKIARSMESLQACERSSLTAEGQLERAMGWACGAPNIGATGNSSTKTSGIPAEFHDHLMRRRKFLWEAREKASDIVKICISIMEFEASSDGIFHNQGEIYPLRKGEDGRSWQQACLNVVSNLEVTYQSFTRAEQEWKLAQTNMEDASNSLYLATNELRIASLKAQSASGDLQSTVLKMRDCAYEASVALTAFSRVLRGHTALTSESGSMLEEVLAITEDLHDVHSLGREAAAIHHSLTEDLSKANATILPLESILSKDVAAMTDAMARERETKKEVSPIHGQAIYQSYCLRVREACQTFRPLVPSLTLSVKGLYSMLIRLARTASLHSGNLHKALEGLGESQEVKSQGISLSRPDLDDSEFDDKGRESLSRSDSGSAKDFLDVAGVSLHDKDWISPPDSVYSSSLESGTTSAEASLPDSFADPAEVIEQTLYGSSPREATDFLNSDAQDFTHSGQSVSKHMELNNGNTGSANSASSKPLSCQAVTGPTGSLQPMNENMEMKYEGKDKVSSLNRVQIEDEKYESPTLNTLSGGRVARGKNAYAMSILRHVEMKLDGQDIAANRDVSIAEQVDYLLKQATSIDNLCNMYEGWTPWI
ncbi:PI3_PI4_kinase domain-containing protein/FATC domain-containing protein [Cephalotus follicularis]|uniref:non-specific serine/threonine protein kinase n=1 Tax=Cephalotus follicularis TaxID=3775 RepID=A0A1Q3C4A7_CEPFO|nr:PI3_PI4_kinase domain-containing protein/FATC domain-containing protein [Cephalotus follicularis]